MESSTLTLTGRLDPREGWTASACPISKAMEVVGTRSALLLMREAFYGTRRFDDFAERVGISQPVAASRLRELVEAGLMVRTPYQDPHQRTRMEYQLTQMGAELFPALAALMQWGDTWLGASGVELRHHDCGELVHAELRCEGGHHTTVAEIDLVARPRKRT